MDKTIRSNKIKQSMEDYNNLTSKIQENTTMAVETLLNDAVRTSLADIISEGKDDDYEVEDDKDGKDVEGKDTDSSSKGGKVENDGKDADGDASGVLDELEARKVGDDTYDFEDADEEELEKLQAILGDDDQILVKVDGDTVEIEDNERGTEYTIDLETGEFTEDGDGQIGDEEDDFEIDVEDEPEDDEFDVDVDDEDDDVEFDVDLDDEDDDIDFQEDEDECNECNEGLNYTTGYQRKTAMTMPKNNGEKGRFNAGVPTGDGRRWGKPGDGKPFEKNVKSDLDEEFEGFDTDVEESIHVGGADRNSVVNSVRPNSKGRRARNAHVAGAVKNGTSVSAYSNLEESLARAMKHVTVLEGKLKNYKRMVEENKKLQKSLEKFGKGLQEAAVTNHSLGMIINLITENATTSEEKKEIIKRFGKEAHTIEESKRLYASMSNELKKKAAYNINEEKQMTTTGTQKLNETKIYADPDIQKQIELMHRVERCK